MADQNDPLSLVKQAISSWESLQVFLIGQGLTWDQAKEIVAEFESSRLQTPKEEVLANLDLMAQMQSELSALVGHEVTAAQPQAPQPVIRPKRMIMRL